MSKVIIIADDLTGANDTAIQFVKQGLSGLVILNSGSIRPDLFGNYDVISINTNSRILAGDEAYEAVYRTVKQLGTGVFVYKKVDSVLRGNPGEELGAVMDALDIPLALAAPSFPANKSLLEKGILNGKTDAVQVFARGTGRKTEGIPLELVRKGSGAMAEFINSRNETHKTKVFVADAVTDDDLAIINKASAMLEPHVLAGSAGLGNQLAHYPGKAKTAETKKPASLAPILIIAGTRMSETAAQIRTLCNSIPASLVNFRVSMIAQGQTEKAIDSAFNEVSHNMGQGSKLHIVAVDSMFRIQDPAGQPNNDIAEGDETSAAICEALGILTDKLMNSFRFPVFLSTGGDTSMAICRRLGINAIEPLAEICPGIPLGRIFGGPLDQRHIVTKSGRFGNPASLVEIVNYLAGGI